MGRPVGDALRSGSYNKLPVSTSCLYCIHLTSRDRPGNGDRDIWFLEQGFFFKNPTQKFPQMFPPFDLVVPKRLEVAMTWTEGNLSAINESLVQLSATLSCIAARQGQMLVNLKKMTVVPVPITTTMPVFVPEQQTSKPSSTSPISDVQVVGAGTLHADVQFCHAHQVFDKRSCPRRQQR
ncbi:hypothetical protein QYE76_015966 [Lolium multiflorum]|uniref:Uncharacterized protein n=1 Tax=Lolium multiflorum TaxID=4521 RepID=A0AAD8U931_LOLMU|nr:hypothetical protein QYE76_015966 [Lolium multiflorum]